MQNLRSIIRSTVAVLACLALTPAGLAREPGQPDPLFQSDEFLEIHIAGPISTLMAERSDGTIAVRGDDMTSGALIEAGGTKHGRMPYWSISDETVADTDRLLDVAGIALDTARRPRSPRRTGSRVRR